MGRVIYSALDINGKDVNGYIEATSNEEAILKLEDIGFHTIELHSEAFFSGIRDDLDGLKEKELACIARFEKEHQKNPNILTSFNQLIINNKVVSVNVIILVILGVYSDTSWIWIIGLLFLAGMILPWLYGYRKVWMLDEIYRLKAFGERDKALQTIAKLKKKLDKNPKALFELDKIQAEIMLCRDGSIHRAKLIISRHKPYLDEALPGMYENAEASLHYIVGEYHLFLEKFRQTYELYPQNTMAMDLAFAEAKYGDTQRASALLEEVNIAALPAYASGMYDWTLGVIAHREDRLEEARKHFIVMMEKFDPYINNPIVWEMVALASGTYADLLFDKERKEEGVQLLQPGTVKILNVAADDILRTRLSQKYPDIISKECHCIREKDL